MTETGTIALNSTTAKNIAILGSTGSIGTSAVEVIAASGGELQALALSAHAKFSDLVAQAQQLRPRWVVATDKELAEKFDWAGLPEGTELLTGQSGLQKVATAPEVDVVLAAIVGSAGLQSTWAALEAKKTVALANKETLVMAGPLVMELVARHGATILPVDSEHSAVFQALKSGTQNEIQRIVLTASGGPFRDTPTHELLQVTVADALAHPTWNMGPKITIDSATMMNKSLEIVEARWLFGVPADKIEVMIHPQSVVHALVEYVDGSVVAQMSPPDMKLPIQYALHYPDRRPGVAKRVDWSAGMHFDFYPPDRERFPALELGHLCARQGGTCGAVLNAANEAAVQGFLDGELHFTEIVPACQSVLESHEFEANPTLEQLLAIDAWARNEVSRWVCA